uniref:Uncharacterized protein n=1 Tax=Arundo donax TaxID=35708 RepID=A0A0A8Z968_ARUDO
MFALLKLEDPIKLNPCAYSWVIPACQQEL